MKLPCVQDLLFTDDDELTELPDPAERLEELLTRWWFCLELIRSEQYRGFDLVLLFDTQSPAEIISGWIILRSWDSFLVEVLESWLKGCKFESLQEWRENFLLQSHLCVLTLIGCPFHPHVTAVACKRPRSYRPKVQVAGYSYTCIHPLPNEVGGGWPCHCPGIV